MKNLLITGSLAYDRIAVFRDRFSNHILPEKVHQLNVCFAVDHMEVYYGGTAGNIAYTLNLLDEQPPILTMIGKDGQNYLNYLKERGMETRYIRTSKTRLTANAMIITDLKDNQVTSFYQGAQLEVDQLSLEDVKEEVDVVILAPNHVPSMIRFAQTCRERGFKFIADPGQQITVFEAEGLRSFAEGAHILIVNDYEWSLFEKMTGWDLHETLQKVAYVIITYGEKGSTIHQNGQVPLEIPSYPASKVVDPTGCGDAYRAGLLYGLKYEYSMEQSAHMGAWLATQCIQSEGTQNHGVDKEGWKNLLKTF